MICFLRSSRTVKACCQTTSYASKMAHRPIRLASKWPVPKEWIWQHSPEVVKKDEWPPNSPDPNPLDYHVWGAMLERYKVFTAKPTNKAELKTVLEAIWEDLPQEAIDLAVLAFRKRLQACIRADGGHSEHLLNRQHQQTALFRAKNQFKKN